MTEFLIVLLTIFQVFMLILAFLLLLFTFSILVYAIIGRVPWVPTRGGAAKFMMKHAGVKKGETVLDLGCGDGSMLHVAVKDFGAKAIGYDLNPVLLAVGRIRSVFSGAGSQMSLKRGNIFKIDIPKVDVVAVYLLDELNAKLEPRLVESLPAGTRVVSRSFRFPNLNLVKTDEFAKEKYYLYEL